MPQRRRIRNRGNGAAATILVAEPDVLVRMVISDYLRECGYRVAEAANADDVIVILQSAKRIDVVLSEVRLSGQMDGFELARWVRTNHPSVEVVLASGITSAAGKAGDLCDNGPLEKPYHPQQVEKRIKMLLERRGAKAKVSDQSNNQT